MDGCAEAWAEAMRVYALLILPKSSTVESAAAILSLQLKTTFQLRDKEAMLDLLESNFADFAKVVSSSMPIGTPPYNFTLPVGKVGFKDLFRANPLDYPKDWAIAATNFTSKIDTWMRTGTGTLIPFPFTLINWN